MSTPAKPQLTVRHLRAEDVPTVAEYERDIACISFPEDPVTDLDFYARKLGAAIGDDRNELLVVDDGEAVVGWAWLTPRANFVTQEVYADLKSFYVDRHHRGTRCAFLLMRACLDYCAREGLPRVVGRTNASNENMQALYRMFSFEPRHITFERRVETTAQPARPRRERNERRGKRR